MILNTRISVGEYEVIIDDIGGTIDTLVFPMR